MPTVSLTSYLKILTKGTPQKVREYSKYLEPGGYDFYWSLKDAVHSYTVGGMSFADCASIIQDIPREIERKHNLAGLQSLSKWLTKHGVANFFEPPVTNCSSPEGHLTVKLEPEFGFIPTSGQRRIVQMWNSKSANLTRDAVGVGIYLMQKHLCVGECTDCAAGILDLRKRHLFVADSFPTRVEAMVTTEFAWADSFFREHRQAA